MRHIGGGDGMRRTVHALARAHHRLGWIESAASQHDQHLAVARDIAADFLQTSCLGTCDE